MDSSQSPQRIDKSQPWEAEDFGEDEIPNLPEGLEARFTNFHRDLSSIRKNQEFSIAYKDKSGKQVEICMRIGRKTPLFEKIIKGKKDRNIAGLRDLLFKHVSSALSAQSFSKTSFRQIDIRYRGGRVSSVSSGKREISQERFSNTKDYSLKARLNYLSSEAKVEHLFNKAVLKKNFPSAIATEEKDYSNPLTIQKKIAKIKILAEDKGALDKSINEHLKQLDRLYEYSCQSTGNKQNLSKEVQEIEEEALEHIKYQLVDNEGQEERVDSQTSDIEEEDQENFVEKSAGLNSEQIKAQKLNELHAFADIFKSELNEFMITKYNRFLFYPLEDRGAEVLEGAQELRKRKDLLLRQLNQEAKEIPALQKKIIELNELVIPTKEEIRVVVEQALKEAGKKLPIDQQEESSPSVQEEWGKQPDPFEDQEFIPEVQPKFNPQEYEKFQQECADYIPFVEESVRSIWQYEANERNLPRIKQKIEDVKHRQAIFTERAVQGGFQECPEFKRIDFLINDYKKQFNLAYENVEGFQAEDVEEIVENKVVLQTLNRPQGIANYLRLDVAAIFEEVQKSPVNLAESLRATVNQEAIGHIVEAVSGKNNPFHEISTRLYIDYQLQEEDIKQLFYAAVSNEDFMTLPGIEQKEILKEALAAHNRKRIKGTTVPEEAYERIVEAFEAEQNIAAWIAYVKQNLLGTCGKPDELETLKAVITAGMRQSITPIRAERYQMQMEALDKRFLHQQSRGGGNCFYLSYFAGICHVLLKKKLKDGQGDAIQQFMAQLANRPGFQEHLQKSGNIEALQKTLEVLNELDQHSDIDYLDENILVGQEDKLAPVLLCLRQMAVFCLKEEFYDVSAAEEAEDQSDVEGAKERMLAENAETLMYYAEIFGISDHLFDVEDGEMIDGYCSYQGQAGVDATLYELTALRRFLPFSICYSEGHSEMTPTVRANGGFSTHGIEDNKQGVQDIVVFQTPNHYAALIPKWWEQGDMEDDSLNIIEGSHLKEVIDREQVFVAKKPFPFLPPEDDPRAFFLQNHPFQGEVGDFEFAVDQIANCGFFEQEGVIQASEITGFSFCSFQESDEEGYPYFILIEDNVGEKTYLKINEEKDLLPGYVGKQRYQKNPGGDQLFLDDQGQMIPFDQVQNCLKSFLVNVFRGLSEESLSLKDKFLSIYAYIRDSGDLELNRSVLSELYLSCRHCYDAKLLAMNACIDLCLENSGVQVMQYSPSQKILNLISEKREEIFKSTAFRVLKESEEPQARDEASRMQEVKYLFGAAFSVKSPAIKPSALDMPEEADLRNINQLREDVRIALVEAFKDFDPIDVVCREAGGSQSFRQEVLIPFLRENVEELTDALDPDIERILYDDTNWSIRKPVIGYIFSKMLCVVE